MILSGRYCGPLISLQGKRGILLSIDRKSLTSDTKPFDMVLVQWDDLKLWERSLSSGGTGWAEHYFQYFDDLHLTSDEDVA